MVYSPMCPKKKLHIQNNSFLNLVIQNSVFNMAIHELFENNLCVLGVLIDLSKVSLQILFLLYVNDLSNASKILHLIMFADDTNLFFSNCDIPVLFPAVNSKTIQRFLANKFSFNITETKYLFLNKRVKNTTYY